MNNRRSDLAGTSVADLLRQHPECIPVFLRLRMSCVGCSMAAFETVSDAARIYGLDEPLFLAEIDTMVKSTPKE